MNRLVSVLLGGVIMLQSIIAGVAFAASPLSDIAGHKYKTAIEYLYSQNIIHGYDNGTFKPDNKINRAELLKILVGGAGYTEIDSTSYKNCFPDVKEEWYAKYVCFAKEKNWVMGYADGTFKPGQNTNKVEAMKMLLHSQGLPVAEKASGKSQYKDVDFKQWYGSYMFVAEAMQIVNIEAADYSPKAFITRGEISDNIYRAMLILKYQVGNFDEALIEMSADKKIEVIDEPVKDPVIENPPVQNPPAENPPAQPAKYDAPVLTVSSNDPNKVLLKWTYTNETGGSALASFILEYKKENDLNYQSSTYSAEFYNNKQAVDGGIIFASKPSTLYHFRVKSVNEAGVSSPYSQSKSITTAQPLEPDVPTVEVIYQDFDTLTIKVKAPSYSGNSALKTLFKSFVNPNNSNNHYMEVDLGGINENIETYNLAPKLDDQQPTYKFTYWVSNTNGKESEKVVFEVPGLSPSPGRPTAAVQTITDKTISFKVLPVSYTGSSDIDQYHYKVEASTPVDNNVNAGSYGKAYFENDLKFVLPLTGLQPNTEYTVSFWIVNLDGKVSSKTTEKAKTLN